MNYFKDKVFVITGGNGGLGKALTEQLIQLEAKVVCLDIGVEQQVQPNRLVIETDITQIQDVKNAILKVDHYFGKIDVLINNAGITHMSLFEDTSIELFEKIVNVNLMGSVITTKACLPYIKKQAGHIVSISSVAGFAPLYGRSAYSASKYALEGFAQSIEAELIEHNIHFTIVRPSFVHTRPDQKVQVNSGISSPGAAKKNMLGTPLKPEEAARTILDGIANKKRVVLLGKVAKAAYWLSRLFPKMYLKKMISSSKDEFLH
jgi:short-subunit dehydrogenase